MSDKKYDIQAIITTAVTAAYEAGIRGIDEKIEKAVSLGMAVGIEIGAKVGAEIGTREALRTIERERKQSRKKQHDKRLHNTELLLKHYRSLNEHYKHAVFNTSRAETESESFSDIIKAMNTKISDDDLYIESIKRSCVRTKVIMAHVNRMLEIYKDYCTFNGGSTAQDWRILEAMYISAENYTAEEIAKKESVARTTVFNSRNRSIERLTTLIFGIDGIEELN